MTIATQHLVLAASILVACSARPLRTSSPPDDDVNLLQACAGRNGWSDPAPPKRIFGNVYMVGTCGIVSLLITSEDGHILIDGATEEAAPSIAANIRSLGFDIEDVHYLLNTHEHLDHAGGLARLKELTGAQLLARAEATHTLATGIPEESDPQHGELSAFRGVAVDRVIADGETVALGSLRLTASATPGHAPGGTSWLWRSCEAELCYDFVYADSLGAVSADAYRFSDHTEYVEVFRSSMERVARLPRCDVLITPHPSQSDFFERLSGAAPLVDRSACERYGSAASHALDERIRDEATR